MQYQAGMVAVAMLLLTRTSPAQPLHEEALVRALRQGGFVIVMRHAGSPREVPSKQTANADNVSSNGSWTKPGPTRIDRRHGHAGDLRIFRCLHLGSARCFIFSDRRAENRLVLSGSAPI
jgi:hypothetical protein